MNPAQRIPYAWTDVVAGALAGIYMKSRAAIRAFAEARPRGRGRRPRCTERPAAARHGPAPQPDPRRRVRGRGMIQIRPIALADAQAFRAFVERLSPESRYERFQYVVKEVSPALLRLLMPTDPRKHVALAAFEGGQVVGEARYVREADGAEFAIAVADEFRRRGVGKQLFQTLLGQARRDGLKRLDGEVLAWNRAMLGFVEQQGFRVRSHPGDARLLRIEFEL
jgi:GNAT superfamily N-acetyltransferase